MVRVLRAGVVPATLVALVALSGVTLGRIYAGGLLGQLVSGAALGSVLVSLALRRLPSWLVAPVSVAALAGYLLLALRIAAGRAQLAGDLAGIAADAARNGIPRLLTAMIPVEPTPDTVAVPVVAAWLAGLAGAELAVRGGRVLSGYAPPAALYAGAAYVVGPNAVQVVWPALAFAAVATVGLAVTGRPPAPAVADVSASVAAALRIRAAAGVAGGAVLVVALAAVLGPWAAARVATTPDDPRRYVQPPQVDSLDESPLIRISGWALDPGQRLLEVHTGGAAVAPGGRAGGPVAAPAPNPTGSTTPTVDDDGDRADRTGTGQNGGEGDPTAGARLRLAVLPDYDGVTWRVGATYRNAGRSLPTAPVPAGTRVEVVEQQVTVAGLSGRLLPAVPTPRRVAGTRVAYDPGTATLIRPEGLAPGLRYTVTSARERPDLNLLPSADVPAGDPVARFVRLGDQVPDQLRRLADEFAASGAPYQRATAIEQFLGEHYRLVADAPSGHAYPNLTFFLFGPRQAGGQRGTSEQFAASFAVLGRLVGLPTRVVVGFRVPADGQVRAANAYAWPEVLFNGVGWVAFDPLPQPDVPARPVEEDFNPRSPPPPPSEAPTPPAPEPSASVPVAAAPRRGPAAAPLVVGGSATLLVSGVVAVAAVAVLRRAQRRRRLFAGAPAERVSGAWLEVADALRLAGRPAAGHLAAAEVAAHAARVADGLRRPAPLPPIDGLAALVNTTAFAPGGVDGRQADEAGAEAVAYTAGLRAGRPWWRRWWWSVHPGPLRWHRRR